ncbi:ROK family protein [Lichenihabitans psoromatis]|uniref:ROK family protein n=1 Tax=Lichenihabitans psoromatis TaxID=2528642 RepID=UPI001FE2237B|nr:ROK family protein [Lichenihabitans psoromatis]
MQHSATAIGIDIGGTNLRVGRVSSGGEILDWVAEPITRDPRDLLDRIVEICRRLDDETVAGIGIGVPGRVDARHRAVLSGGYIDLASASLAEDLEAALGKPVVIDNDCNMALVAEIATGAAQGYDNVVMFTIGTGIGGAVVMEGKIVRGRATAGQLGHLTVAQDGLACACGRRGCVETTSSGTALRRLIREAGLPASTVVEDLFVAEAAGDPIAGRILDTWASPLRTAIDSMVAAADPDVIVLGGGLGGAAHRALSRAPAVSPWYQCGVVAAQLGDDAGVIGAAISALVEHMMEPEATTSAPYRDVAGLGG